jgi:hypothetical protein
VLAADVFDQPPHKEVYLNNINLAKSIGSFTSSPPPFVKISQPSESNPFYFTFFKFTSALPSVSNRVTASKLPEVFWIWGESHPATYTIYYKPNACGTSFTRFTAISNASLVGNLYLQLYETSKSYFFNESFENPFKVDFSLEDIKKLNTTLANINTKQPKLPTLTIKFNGNVEILYYVLEVVYVVIQTKEGIECKVSESSWVKKFSIPVGDTLIFDVEYNEPLFLLVQPIDDEQLSFNPQVKYVFLTNMNANTISVNHSSFLAYSKFANYKIEKDFFGYENIKRQELNPLYFFNKTSSNSSFLFFNGKYVNSNYNFAHQFYSHTFLAPSIGKINYYFHFYDDFEHLYTFKKDLIFRSASGIRSFNENKTAFLTDNKAEQITITNNRGVLQNPKTQTIRANIFSNFQFFLEDIFSNLPLLLLILVGFGLFSKTFTLK